MEIGTLFVLSAIRIAYGDLGIDFTRFRFRSVGSRIVRSQILVQLFVDVG